MKLTLELPAKGSNHEGSFTIQKDNNTQDRLTLRTVTGMGKINVIIFDLQEANELREWLNKNLPR